MSKARTLGSGLAMPWPARGLRISCLSLLHLILPAYLGSDNRGRWTKPQCTGMLMVFHRRRKKNWIASVTELGGIFIVTKRTKGTAPKFALSGGTIL